MQWNRDNPLALVEQSDETAAANAALGDYALLGDGRSLALLALEYQNRPKVGPNRPPTRHLSMLKTWSARYDWQARVTAYDQQKRQRARELTDQLWAERQAQSRESTWETAQLLRDKVQKMLEFPLATVERETDTQQTDDGRTIIINKTIVKPARWGMRELAQLADTAAKLERLAAEMPTDHVKLDGLTPKDLEGMTREQLEILRQQLLAKKG